MGSNIKKHVLIVGAGPAGLTAGIELLKSERYAVTLLEREAVVGGLARTTDYKGCKFDIGPHHFITEAPHIEAWWKEVMKDDFIKHKRFTRIFYNRHFFHYPLEPLNVIRGLSLFECVRSVLSYVKYRFFPIKKITSFQDWVTNKFGARLFSIFFKTYTEKVWGIPCDKISSDWAAQRIKGFSLSKAIFYAFFGRWFKKNAPRTLSDAFYYPSLGAGTMWEKVAGMIQQYDEGLLHTSREVVAFEHTNNLIVAAIIKDTAKEGSGGAQKLQRIDAEYFLSTMPLRTLIHALDPIAPKNVLEAANSLQYRGLITVNLIVNATDICPDHWIYVHEKAVRMGRIGNMNNFSMKMSDTPGHTALSLEYFAFVDEPFWHKSDAELIAVGTQELESTGLIPQGSVIDGMVMKTSDAYPVYDANYKQHLDCVLEYLKTFKNLHLMGRNGLHRYNNMDIAMLSAMDVVKTIIEEEQPAAKKQHKTTHLQAQM